jgi:isoaspartyl peptidase/L-asparaginase-like protein (Ntn-hydrolase superfamily)
MKRRNFLKIGSLGFAGAALIPSFAKAGENESVDSKKKFVAPPKPVLISTWSHGIEANRAGMELLKNGGDSLDAVEAAAKVTESDITNRSVGIGGRPDKSGHVTLDACIMNWESQCGSVGCLEGIAHPISVARHIMENTQHVMLVGEGARKYAVEHDFDKIKTPLPEVKKDWKKWKKEQAELAKRPEINHENHDTIGILAMDSEGRISGACTTSGWAYKLPGRLGDSPIIGAGLFIDQEVGGAVATGLGEAIIRIAGSHTVVELMRQGMHPRDACKEAVDRIIAKHKDLTGLQCGFIAINSRGLVGAYSVYNGFNFAHTTASGESLIDAEYDRTWE